MYFPLRTIQEIDLKFGPGVFVEVENAASGAKARLFPGALSARLNSLVKKPFSTQDPSEYLPSGAKARRVLLRFQHE